MTSPSGIAEKFRLIAARWAVDARPRLANLGDALAALAAGADGADPARLEAARRLAHALAGSAGTIGYPDISRALLPLEERLTLMVEQGRIGPSDAAYLADVARAIPALIDGLLPEAAILPGAASNED